MRQYIELLQDAYANSNSKLEHIGLLYVYFCDSLDGAFSMIVFMILKQEFLGTYKGEYTFTYGKAFVYRITSIEYTNFAVGCGFTFRLWDPRKSNASTIIQHLYVLFYNLEDKVDFEGIDNDRVWIID